jgi:hypothetical protein
MMVALVVGGMFASVVLTGWLVRSFFVEDFWSYIAPDKSVVRNIFVRRGRVYFSHSLGKYFEIEDESRGWSYSTGKPTNPGFDSEANARKFGRSVVLAGFAYLSEPKTQFVIVIVPLWIPVAGGVMPFMWVVMRPKRPAGSCPACGYDLRATPERCPECGWKRQSGAAAIS